MAHPLKVDFDVSSRDFSWQDLMNWWESMRPWFLERGYVLYHQDWEFDKDFGDCLVSTSPRSVTSHVPQEHPYSFIGGDSPDPKIPELSQYINGRVVCAQDLRNRHVAIKLMKIESGEYRILRTLSREPSLLSAESFGCVIPPLDFLEFDDHCFVVMPRWGDGTLKPWFSHLFEILDYMRCLLQGLCFLHERLIAHRDIKVANVIMNHIGRDKRVSINPLRIKLRTKRRALYALFDFDWSVMFDRSSTPAERRLPGRDSFISGGNFAYDTAQGELDYDPFAFDVGALGQLFCFKFQQLTPIAPFLAPFLDRIITRDVTKRFTAREALSFFEEFSSQLSRSQLNKEPSLPSYLDPETYNRWAGLSEDFIQQWALYREPKLPRTTKILRRICGYEWGYTTVQWVRRVCMAFSRLSASFYAVTPP